MSEIDECMARCPDFLDFPTAWAIQRSRTLGHHPKCSSAPQWAMLCDCGAVIAEYERIKAALRGENTGQPTALDVDNRGDAK